ncbi:hypothetical protein BYT27DRAFT_7224369 [Phlegmacium glaucopus]|nr:hypothetical protein BYT27DRAFT_7224369 [Phlegmacium glaucopus]
MTHISPASYLVWTVLTSFVLLGAFLINHLWSFDRFQSLRWNSGSGTFKRVMIYTYLLTLPLLFIYAFGFTIIKYSEGFIDVPFLGVVPKPYFLWGSSSQRAIFPLTFMFSMAWALELLEHIFFIRLYKLCFWLFLINASSVERSWFQSPYFKTWVVGSIVAILYMPLISILTRSDPLKNEAYCVLGGSLGGLCLTIWFLPILWSFPSFLNNLRSEGVDTATIVRLTKFSELNTIRVVFRFLFTVPLLILGVDGVRPHSHVNESLFATDFLVLVSGFGCIISSAITLVIFFPRSIEGEIAARDAAKERKRSRKGNSNGFSGIESHIQMSSRQEPLIDSSYTLASPVRRDFALSSEGHDGGARYHPNKQDWTEEEPNFPETHVDLPPLRPNRKKDIELGRNDRLTEVNLSIHNVRVGSVNPMISNYTSPIDIASYPNTNGARLTFTRR